MKKISCFFSLAVAAFLFAACQQNNDVTYQGIVTFKTLDSDQSCYIQLDPKTVLKPTNDNLKTNPFKKEVRAQVLFYDRGSISKPAGSPYEWKAAEIIAHDSILTKKPVPEGTKYGKAKIEVLNSWMTCMEDGFLTLYFEGLWGNAGVAHTINLMETKDPLTFELKHNCYADSLAIYVNRGLIAFDLHDLPVPDSKEYDLVLKYSGYKKDKTIKFHYKDGVYSSPTSVDSNGYCE